MEKSSKEFVFEHGTSWANAQKIEKEGFIPSSDGCLGPGVYLGRREKALRFAQNSARHGSDQGGLVRVKVKVSNPKFVRSDDKKWQNEGYDSCRADRTSMSQNMEWCVRNPSQIEVLGIRRVNADTASSIIQEASPRQVTPSKHTQASPSLNHASTGSALISPSQSYNYGGELEPKYAFDAYASTGYAESNPSQSYHYAGHRPNYASIGYAENIPSQRSQGHTPTTAFTGFAVARSLEPNGDDSERDTNQPSYYGTTGYAEASFDPYASTGYAESNPSQSYHYAGHRPNYASIGYAENIPSQRSQGHTPTTAFTGFAVTRSLEPNGDDSERDTNQPSYYGTTGYAEASFDPYASTGYAESNPSQSYHYAGHRPNYASIGYAETIPSQRSQGHTPTTAFTGSAVAHSLEPNGDDSECDTNQPSYYETTGYAVASFDADDDNTSNTIENGAACVSCWTEDNDYQYAEENETIQAYDNDTNQYDDGLDYDDVTYSDGGGGGGGGGGNDDYSDNGGGDCDDYSDGGGGGYDDYSDGGGGGYDDYSDGGDGGGGGGGGNDDYSDNGGGDYDDYSDGGGGNDDYSDNGGGDCDDYSDGGGGGNDDYSDNGGGDCDDYSDNGGGDYDDYSDGGGGGYDDYSDGGGGGYDDYSDGAGYGSD